jgi:predicted GNAT family N-acyltransferase
MPPAFSVRPARWEEDENAIGHVRSSVFIEEQGVPEALEWETQDAECLWYMACDDVGNTIGIVRLTHQGRIGRMAVQKTWRGKGVGSALLAAAIDAARSRGLRLLELSAQTHAIAFYARHGFAATGPEYLDAGIPHRTMSLGVLP